MEKKILTLCCVYNNEHVLLGEIKKDGKLKGMFNGFGGKVEPGETIKQAAVRELKEEAGITPLDMRKRGVLKFIFEKGSNPFGENTLMEVHVFSVSNFEGSPIETDEMRPKWFTHSEIPYANMWPDDVYWLPLIFAEKNFAGTFYLKDTKTITKYSLSEIKQVVI